MAVGHHYQNAYVTRNVAKAVASFREHCDPRLVIEHEAEVPLWTPQGEGVGSQKFAFIWVEDFNYELIEPVSGVVLAIYSDALPEDDSLAFHHVCHRVQDWNALQEHVEANPFPVVLKGGTPDMLQFCYVDTRSWLGHYTEYLWCNDERWSQLGGR
jgi:hypothetical protein